ncbi:Uncharacterised protein [uncultured archaeon]|nr:Uncharacterised protein [uncultured archaeon]
MVDDYSYDLKAMKEDQETLRLSRKKDPLVIADGVEENGDAEGYTPVPYDEERDGPRCLHSLSPEEEKELKKRLIRQDILTEKKRYEELNFIGGLTASAGAFLGSIIDYELRKHGAYVPGCENLGTIIWTLGMACPGTGLVIGNYVHSRRNISDLRNKLSELEK